MTATALCRIRHLTRVTTLLNALCDLPAQFGDRSLDLPIATACALQPCHRRRVWHDALAGMARRERCCGEVEPKSDAIRRPVRPAVACGVLVADGMPVPARSTSCAFSGLAAAPRSCSDRQVRQRDDPASKAPSQAPPECGSVGVKDHVVEAIVAVHDAGFFTRRNVRWQTTADQCVHRGDRFCPESGTVWSSGQSGATGNPRGDHNRQAPQQ